MQTTPPPKPPDVPPPSTPPHLVGGVDLRISKRLLWIDSAAYPLHNIARVYTFTAHPRRKEAVQRFVKNLAIVLAIVFGLMALDQLSKFGSSSDGTEYGSQSSGSGTTFWYVCAGAWLLYCLVRMMIVVLAPSRYVMAIETSGPSQAVVTSSNPQTLNQLVGYVAHAIDNPETEFQVKVDRLTISPSNYHFGDNVNMYGGTGNVGIAA